MSLWLLDLLIGSVGLAVASLGLWGFLRRRGADPISSYRLLSWVLCATLAFPLTMVLLQASGFDTGLPFAGRIARRIEDWSARGKTPPGVAHEMQTPKAGSTAEEGPGKPRLAERAGVPGTKTGRSGRQRDTKPRSSTLQVGRTRGDFDPRPSALLDASPARKPEQEQAPTAAGRESSPHPAISRRLIRILLGIYLAGFLLRLARTGLRLRRTHGLLRHARRVTDTTVLSTWESLRAHSPLAGQATLLASPDIAAPMCFGLCRPAVLLPEAVSPALSQRVLSCVLLHELVHLERRDTWIMLGQELLGALFWFHPAAAWLSDQLDNLREQSCDLMVVRRTGRAKRYASALLEYATWMGRSGPEPVSATSLVPWTTTNTQLARRIEMLISKNTPQRTMRASLFAAATALAALFGGQVALAASIAPAQEPPQSDRVEESESVDEVSASPASLDQGSEKPQVAATPSQNQGGIRIDDNGEVIVLNLIPEGKPEKIELRGRIIVIAGDGVREVMRFRGEKNGNERSIEKQTEIESPDGNPIRKLDDSRHWVVGGNHEHRDEIVAFGAIPGEPDPQIYGRIELLDGGVPKVFDFDSFEELGKLIQAGNLKGMVLGSDDSEGEAQEAVPGILFSKEYGDGPKLGITLEGRQPIHTSWSHMGRPFGNSHVVRVPTDEADEETLRLELDAALEKLQHTQAALRESLEALKDDPDPVRGKESDQGTGEEFRNRSEGIGRKDREQVLEVLRHELEQRRRELELRRLELEQRRRELDQYQQWLERIGLDIQKAQTPGQRRNQVRPLQLQGAVQPGNYPA